MLGLFLNLYTIEGRNKREMRKKFTVNLDLQKDIRAEKKIVIKEQDSLTFYFNIYENSVPVNIESLTPRLFIRKSDGTILYQTEVSQKQNNSIVFNVHRQATTCPGLCFAEVELIEIDDLVTTKSFIYTVEPKVGSIEDAIASVDEAYFLKIVEEFIKQAKIDIAQYKEDVGLLLENVENARSELQGFETKLEEADIQLEEAKERVLLDIDARKESSLSQIDVKHTEVLNSIRDTKESAISEINTQKTGALSELDNKLETINASVSESTQQINQLIESAKQTAQEGVQSVQSAKDELNPLLQQAEEKKTALEAVNGNAENLKNALNGVIELANTAKGDLELNTTQATEALELLKAEILLANTAKGELNAENVEANANIAELGELNPEADINIEELKRLIQEAKEIAIPALEEYIKEHTPAQDLTEVNRQLEELYNLMDTHNHDTLYQSAKVVGKFGEGIALLTPDASANKFDDAPPEFGEYKSKLHFRYIASGNSELRVFFFKEDLNDPSSTVYVSFENGTLKINNGIRGENYYARAGTSGQTGTVEFNINYTYEFFHMDFPVYTNDRSRIVFQSPKASGLDDFNNATTPGIYTLNMSIPQFQKLKNRPTFRGLKDVKATLEVKSVDSSILQKLTINSEGFTFVRVIGGDWIRTDGELARDFISTIGMPEGTAVPEPLLSVPSNPFFWKEGVHSIIFQTGDNKFSVYYFYDAPTKIYYSGANTLNITLPANKSFNFDYTASTGWVANLGYKSGSNLGSIDVAKAFFKIYANTMPVHTDNSVSVVHQEPTSLNYNVEPTLLNFRDINKTGKYKVKIKQGDDIAYAPYHNTELLYVAETPLELEIDGDNDGLLTPTEMALIPSIIPVEIKRYVRKAKTVMESDINGYVEAVITENTKLLTFYNINGDILSCSCTDDEWTEWEAIVPETYTKQEIEDISNKNIEASSVNYGTVISSSLSGRNPLWDPLPGDTFKDFPENPDPQVYKWYMKCTHYNYHMIFYFPYDPTGKIGVWDDRGTKRFERLDPSVTHDTYKGYYRQKSSSSGVWTAHSNDNHFTSTSREINAMYEHNFNLVNSKNTGEVFYEGLKTSGDGTTMVSDFNNATLYKRYEINQDGSDIIANSPISYMAFKGYMEVLKVNKYIEQLVITENGNRFMRKYQNDSWTGWETLPMIEYGEHVIEFVDTYSDEDLNIQSIKRNVGTTKDNDKYYVRIAPTKKFLKVTGVSVSSDLADLVIGFELSLNTVLINDSNDFMLFIKNNFKDTTGGSYVEYEGLKKLKGRKIKYCLMGY